MYRELGYAGRVTLLVLACASPTGPEPEPPGRGGYPEPRPIEMGDVQPLSWQELFNRRKLHTLSLRLDDDATAALAADPGGDQPVDIVIDNRQVGRGRLKMRGESTEQRWDGKPSFRLDLPRDDDGQVYAGTDELVLDAMVDDPAQARHLAAAAILADLGALAPAVVPATVSVNGQPFGLYAVVEVVDSLFVERHLGVPGVLWDGTEGADFGGEGLAGWEDTVPDDGRGDPADLMAVATVARSTGDDFFVQLANVVNVDTFFLVWTALAAVGHDEGYPYAPGDVYLFQADEDPRFVFLPWQVDDGWPRDFEPGAAASVLAVRCLYDEPCRRALDETLAATRASLEGSTAQRSLDDVLALTDAAMEADPRRPYASDEVAVARVQLAARLRVWAARLGP